MFKVGITGGIGSGKTLVCRILEILGVPVYYADEEAKRIMIHDELVRKRLIKLLGDNVYDNSGLNRRYIASMIFNNNILLDRMNSIVHPAVQEDFKNWSGNIKDTPYVVEEAAILFESGAASLVDTSVLIYASEGTRVKRVMDRDNIDENSVRERMKNQMSEEEKKSLANYVIINDNDLMLLPQVISIHEEILKNIM